MNRLTWKMAQSWRNTRMFKVRHVDDIRSQRAFEYWVHELHMYHAICECIRKGYKPIREDEE